MPSAKELRKTLKAQLGTAKNPAAFFTLGILQDANTINPGLSIQDVGDFGLPLSPRDAQVIINASSKAPVGTSHETIVNEGEHKIWEIDASRLKFRNPMWQGLIANILASTLAGLGIRDALQNYEAEPYKLILYETGAMFKPHRFTERLPGTFGTLVICLPSQHVGGDVVLSHGDATTTLKTAECSRFDMTYLAWYSDVLHEMQPVADGFRLVVIYNLVNSHATARLSAAAPGEMRDELQKTVHLWIESLEGEEDHENDDGGDDVDKDEDEDEDEDDREVPELLIYKLKHKYTTANLSYDTLKERTVSGDCDLDDGDRPGGWEDYNDDEDPSDANGGHHDITDTTDDTFELRGVVDFSGVKSNGTKHVDKTEIVNYNADEERDPDKEDFDRNMGYGSASATHWYRDTVLVVVPKQSRYTFIADIQSDRGTSAIISYLDQKYHSNPYDADCVHDIANICHLALNAKLRKLSGYSISDNTMDTIISLSVDLQDFPLFEKVTSLLDTPPASKVMSAIGGALTETKWDQIHEILSKAVLKGSSLEGKVAALGSLKSGWLSAHTGQELPKSLQMWTADTVQKALQQISKVSSGDVSTILTVIDWTGSLHISEFARRFVANTAFSIKLCSSGQWSPQLRTALEDVLPLVVDHFNLSSYLNMSNRSQAVTDSSVISDARILARFLIIVWSRKDPVTLRSLREKMQPQAAKLPANIFEALLFPFLLKIVEHAPNFPTLLSDPEIARLSQSLLNAYITNTTGKEPTLQNWTRKGIRGSCCRECLKASRFLQDRNENVARFTIGDKLRKHLEWVLSESDCDFATETNRMPYTLVVTKNNAGFASEHYTWSNQVHMAKRLIMILPQPELKTLLGEHYNSLSQFRPVSLLPLGPLSAVHTITKPTSTLDPAPMDHDILDSRPPHNALAHLKDTDPKPDSNYSSPSPEAIEHFLATLDPSGSSGKRPLANTTPESGSTSHKKAKVVVLDLTGDD